MNIGIDDNVQEPMQYELDGLYQKKPSNSEKTYLLTNHNIEE